MIRSGPIRVKVFPMQAVIPPELKIDVSGELSERLEPPGSGGLLVALAMWRRFLVAGPGNFGDVTYWGTAPVDGRADHPPQPTRRPASSRST